MPAFKPNSKKAKKPYNFSRNLLELRNLALTMTKNKRIKVKYSPKAKNSFYNPEDDLITLTLTPYPDFVKQHAKIAEKILDGDLGHESGHVLLSKPLWGYFNNWITKIKRKRGSLALAKHLVNIVEDKRVNYFIILRYRFDIGKRLKLANLILKDTIETSFKKKPPKVNPQHGEASIMIAILCNEGLYEANCAPLWKILSKKAKEDTKKALEVLEDSTYKRLRIDLIRNCQKLYDLIEPHMVKGADFSLQILVPSRRGGDITGELSDKLKNALLVQIKIEEDKEAQKVKDMLKDLLRGAGAGQGTGEEIPTPEPDFNKYAELLDKNKSEIKRLLDKLKQFVKPILKREIFQRRGRIMPSMATKAYVNSIRRTVRNVYLNVKSQFEKEQVAIGFLIDYSGSVDRTEAEDITTILNEVFGHFVDDYGFAIACFGANSQKVKTFFETFQNTRARIGNITVSASGTEVSVLLTSFLKMFNAIRGRRKILVIASDFEFGDDSRAKDLIKLFPMADVELIFMGFCNCRKVDYWASDELKKSQVRRTKIAQVIELPERFLEVYLNVQK